MCDVLFQASGEIPDVQACNDAVVGAMKSSVMVFIMRHHKDFLFQTFGNAESSASVDRVKVVHQVTVHEIRIGQRVCSS